MAAIAYPPTKRLASATPARDARRLRVVEDGAERRGALFDIEAFPRERARRIRRQRVAKVRAFVLTVGLFAGVWFGAGALVAAHGTTVSPPAGATALAGGGYRYVARVGDSLWSIASAYEPNADPRPLVDDLAAQLPRGQLHVGDVLHLPAP